MTAMTVRKNRVAIISKNEKMITFFSLEAESVGCPVRICSEPPTSLSEFDRVVLDTAEGFCVAENSVCLVAAVVTDEDQALPIAPQEIWEWPVSVERVRAFFEGASASDPDGSAERETTPAIYLLSHTDRTLLYRNRTVTLTPHAWSVLLCLGQGGGEAVSRDRLKECLGEDGGNMTEVYVHHLRKKLEEPFGIRLIDTVRGVGYRLKARLVDREQKL